MGQLGWSGKGLLLDCYVIAIGLLLDMLLEALGAFAAWIWLECGAFELGELGLVIINIWPH